ncbi:hypothetical protein EI94DRAFT_1794038 [Lactarius quietus]|nr:hypothetical protein EI94DRAFT_1794038 [Lactarius quietus]
MALSSDHLSKNDHMNGCKLAESPLLNLCGHINNKLKLNIATAFGHLDNVESKALINVVLYSPSTVLAFIAVLPPSGMPSMNTKHGLPRLRDKTLRLSIVVLSALLEMEPTAIP